MRSNDVTGTDKMENYPYSCCASNPYLGLDAGSGTEGKGTRWHNRSLQPRGTENYPFRALITAVESRPGARLYLAPHRKEIEQSRSCFRQVTEKTPICGGSSIISMHPTDVPCIPSAKPLLALWIRQNFHDT